MALLGKIIGAIRSAAKSIFTNKSGTRLAHPRGAIHAPKMIEHKGQRKSVAEWAKEFGISEATMRWRLQKYGSPEKPDTRKSAIAYKTARVIKGDKSIEIEIDGVRKPLPEVAKELGINYQTLANRIWKGRSIDEVLATVKTPNRDYSAEPTTPAKQWEWNGEKHTVKEWAKIYGIKPAMMRLRLKQHGSPERNCERLNAYKERRAKRYEWNGESHTVDEWMKIVGLSESAMRERLKKSGNPYDGGRQRKPKVEEPVVSPEAEENPSQELLGFKGQWKPVEEWAEEYGISVAECEHNFDLYGEPTKPADEEEYEALEPADEEQEIDRLLKEEPREENGKQSIKEWLQEIQNQPDDETPLKEVLGIKDHFHTLDKIVPKISV